MSRVRRRVSENVVESVGRRIAFPMWSLAPLASRARRNPPSRSPRRPGDSLDVSTASRVARWAALCLYVLVASGLPIPTLVARGAAGENGATTACGRGVCGCSAADRLLGNCCCATRAALPIVPAKRSCCASKTRPAPSGDCCSRGKRESPDEDRPASDESRPTGVTIGFVVGLDAAKCRGEDLNAGVFLLPHLPPLVAAVAALEVSEDFCSSPALFAGRSADPPSPPPRVAVAL